MQERAVFTNLRFADDIVVNAEEEKLKKLTPLTPLIQPLRGRTEISPDNTRVMTNNPNGFQRDKQINGKRLEAVCNVKYLRLFIFNKGLKQENFP